MAVNVQILGTRRAGVGPENAVLWVDLMVGTSHQTLAFHEAQLAKVGTAAEQVAFIVAQAMTAAATALSNSSIAPHSPDLRGTRAATGSIAMAGVGVTQRTVTADAVVGLTDYLIFADATAGNINLTLPAATGNGGQRFEVVKTDSTAHTVTLTATGSENIDGAATLVLALLGLGTVITSNNANWSHTPTASLGVTSVTINQVDPNGALVAGAAAALTTAASQQVALTTNADASKSALNQFTVMTDGSIEWNAKTTTTFRSQAIIQPSWRVATDASRAAQLSFQLRGTGGAEPPLVEALALSVTGAATPLLGALGAAPVARQAGASAAGIASISDAPAKAAITALQNAMNAFGFVTAPA